jgi:hypothetical protein
MIPPLLGGVSEHPVRGVVKFLEVVSFSGESKHPTVSLGELGSLPLGSEDNLSDSSVYKWRSLGAEVENVHQ